MNLSLPLYLSLEFSLLRWSSLYESRNLMGVMSFEYPQYEMYLVDLGSLLFLPFLVIILA